MTLSLFASHCLALVALLLAGQQLRDRYVIEFPKLEQEVKNNFGADKALHVSALETKLHDLENKAVKEQLIGVNAFFDEHIQYATDDIVFKQKDYWATPSELFGHSRGDCEDYAIAKYVALLHLGIDSSKLRLIYVKAKIGRSRVTQAHMVLGYYDSPSSDPLVLDSLVSNVLPGSQRTDLIPVFSFNDSGIWQPGKTAQVSSSTSRLSRWRDVIERMKQEGISRRS
ncbi:transglutaminase-like cysteine peptidase [Alteromonas sp. PRIM-21]|uniref:transglutaminase-like cysteine peptidase n=1 Tax=Alteromonas sp. PRIM-21 TaxID=1454978 RepID=UPI0022B99E24|nr:transglutaminase-like cysteine peptidase [Alteromonas sp. PRIM-21]MCZ8527899.1 transglutaminase-like cysteine peptidase [Alteromonas sp. PRIM-21]